MIKILLFILVGISLTSCSSIEILPGLCYNDRDGTHLCPEESPLDKEPQKKTQLNCSTFGMIEYCYARHKLNQICHCVDHNDMSNSTDFLWNS